MRVVESAGNNSGLLKYRVPRPEGDPKPIEPLQDAQRAMAILRSRAAELKLDPKRIGVLGFSAGGHLSARLSNSTGHRAYEPIDAVDQQEFVPNFTLLIYPAYLYDKNDKDPEAVVSADIPVSKDTPPAFVTMAVDDPVDSENALRYATALKRAKVPVSLHLYPSGGHGYGLRSTKSTSTTWPDRAEEWLKASGYLAE